MATVGVLNVSLRARTSKFTSAMKKARRSIQRFARAVPGASLVTSKFSAILSGAAAVGFAVWIRRTMSAIDATAKLADRIGTTTEALQGLRYAADITGAGASTLDKAMQFLAKSLGEASTGVGESKQALDLLGIEVHDLLGLDPAEQFRRIADATAHLATQEEKAFAATKLFGRAGVALVNTLDLGSQGLRKMQVEAERLGIAFSRVDAAQVEAANDALTRVGRVMQGIGQKIAIQLAPFIEEAANRLVEFGTEGVNAGEATADAFAAASKIVAYVEGSVRYVTGAVVMLWNSMKAGFILAYEYILRGLREIMKAAQDIVKYVPRVGVSLRQGLVGGVVELTATIRSVEKAKLEAADASIEGWRKMQHAFDSVRRVDRILREFKKAARARARAMVDAAKERKLDKDIAKLNQQKAEYAKQVANAAAAAIEANSKIVEQEQAKAAEMEKQARAAAELAGIQAKHQVDQREALVRELAMLRAGTDRERDRLRIEYELQDAIRAAGDDQKQIDLARQVAAEKLAQLNRDMAATAEQAAQAREREAAATHKTASNLKDITKRFAAVGSRIFGFGAGRVGAGGFSVGQRMRVRAAHAPASPAGGGAAQAIAGAANAMNAAAGAVKGLSPAMGSMVQAAKGLGDEVRKFASQTREAVVHATGKLRDDVLALRAEVKTLKHQLAQASSLGIAGGV